MGTPANHGLLGTAIVTELMPEAGIRRAGSGTVLLGSMPSVPSGSRGEVPPTRCRPTSSREDLTVGAVSGRMPACRALAVAGWIESDRVFARGVYDSQLTSTSDLDDLLRHAELRLVGP